MNENYFSGAIDVDGTIYQVALGRTKRAVGIDLQREQEYKTQIAEMQEILDGYYNKLVSLGEIIPPKTAEQIASEQAELQAKQAESQMKINERLLEAISGLQTQIEEMRVKDVSGYDSELRAEQVSGDSKSDRKAGARSKKSDTAGKEHSA